MTLTTTAAAPVDVVTGASESETARIDRGDHPIFRRLARLRAWVTRRPRLEVAYRVVVAAVGGALTLSGVALLALPGPGWLTVFLGLAVLGTEFHWARRISAWLKARLARFWAWWNARRARREAGAAAAAS